MENKLNQLFQTEKRKFKPPISQNTAMLFQKGTQNSIPLNSISYDVEIIDSLAFINLTQSYFNLSPNPIETEFYFAISDNACFYEFQAEIDGQIMIGQVKERQEAKAEYEQNKFQGNIVAYSEMNKEVQDVMKINIGNIPSYSSIKIKFGFLQELDVCLNKFWKLLLPATMTPRYNSTLSKPGNEDLEKENYQNFDFPQVKKGYEWNINVTISSKTEISFIKSPSHEIFIKYLDNTNTKLQVQLKKSEIPNKDFTLLFRNVKLNQMNVSLAHIDNSESPFCAMVTFMPNFNPWSDEDAFLSYFQNSEKSNYDINLLNSFGEYIFLLDRSGSMEGNRIEMAKTALALFIKSLPPNSYFNIVGFGGNFELLYESSTKTSDNQISYALKVISQIEANLGGTEIYQPLQWGLKSPKISHYPKNIFILTDGEVSDVVQILSLIHEYNKLCKVYTIGVGNGCSRSIIVEGAKVGKGKHEFIADNEDMSEKILSLLEDSITPFLSNFHMDYDYSMVDMVVPSPSSIDFIRRNEELRVFVLLNKNFIQEKQMFLKLSYFDCLLKNDVSQNIGIYMNDLVIQKDYLHKYAVYETIKRIQRNLNYQKNYETDLYISKKDNLETYCLDMALRYQIITPFTSFICIIKNTNNFLNQSEKIVIPSIQSVDYNASASHDNLITHFIKKKIRNYDDGGEKLKTSCGNRSNETIKKASLSSNLQESFARMEINQKNENMANKVKEPWLTLLEKQRIEGYWEMNEENISLLKIPMKNISDLATFGGKNLENIWMTCAVLFFFEIFHKDKIGSWKLICKKGEQWMQSQGFIYASEKDKVKKIFYGECCKPSNQIPLIKNCKCGKKLVFVRSIPTYQNNVFFCDSCTACKLIDAGAFHCQECEYDLCEECNNEKFIHCKVCEKGILKWMVNIPQPEYADSYCCDICSKIYEIKKGVYHCTICGNFDLCLMCEANR